ncbi:SOH1 [Candida pseudojiufengensis]|uniref:SOH1 n=1 Tax=Candida pseudojiufengensis TaxID=497109 RepID=UPI0022246AC4|nr:SOH1 [Candida pseudojiufengensis]KAI5962116.1 SOH1 [Candida pseudojiufengensis]
MSEIDQPALTLQTNENNAQQEKEYTELINSLPSRWEIELEFVQSLSNLPYVSYLAQNNYLKDENFINYLKYLQYWNNPNYSRFLVYPNCLHILNLLQSEEFRINIVNPDVMNVLMNDMVKRWQNDDKNGVELAEDGKD